VRRLGGSIVHDIPPGTLAEILDDVSQGGLYEYALARFLVEFHTDRDAESHRRRIEDEPELAPNPVLNALLGAAGEHLARRWDLGEARPATGTLRPTPTRLGYNLSHRAGASPDSISVASKIELPTQSPSTSEDGAVMAETYQNDQCSYVHLCTQGSKQAKLISSEATEGRKQAITLDCIRTK
jgi:hypothetical protein